MRCPHRESIRLLISGSKVRALVRPPSKALKSLTKLGMGRYASGSVARSADPQRTRGADFWASAAERHARRSLDQDLDRFLDCGLKPLLDQRLD
jgi:hypothetical protein